MHPYDLRMPEQRIYTHMDLYPDKWDPRCDSNFPLGNFWPVYVGNFWCDAYAEYATKLQEYFASKGLMVRMVFGRRENDDPFFPYQRKTHLYDFLVYFVRQQDAEDAIYYCHREMYYGHRINVFPGRVPSYFDPKKSVKHVIWHHLRLQMTEQMYEVYIQDKCPVQISCIVQHHKNHFLVEYASLQDRYHAILNNLISTPKVIYDLQQKQRFIEQDVHNEIYERFQKDPWFVNMLPPEIILSSFFNGIRYNCFQWRFINRLRMPQELFLRRPKNYKKKLHIYAFQRALRYFGVECLCSWHFEAETKQQEHLKSKPKAINLTKPSSDSDNWIAVKTTHAKMDQIHCRTSGTFYEDTFEVDPKLGFTF